MDRLARRLPGAGSVWEILSLVYTVEAQPGEPMVAGWGTLFTRTFLSLADYWQGGMGVPAVADGAPRSYLAALLSVISHSLATIVRLVSGLILGGLLGLALGLALSWSVWSRRLVELPTQFLRALPLLAMVPLFQLWFGTYFFGQVLFVAYGVGVIVFAGVVNAVRNVPRIYIDNARALGASQAQLYRTVILPAILPAMRSVVLLGLGAGWGAVLAAEYLGAQSGLGYIIVYAQQFGLLDRMFLIALLFILYTSASYWAIQRLFARLLVWAPPRRARRWAIEIPDQSACSLVELMRRGELSAVETMRAFLNRISELEPKVRAFAYLDPDAALAGAERADKTRAAGAALGSLHGLPVAVKDIIDTADMPTEFGGEIFAGRRPSQTRPSCADCATPARSSSARPSPRNMLCSSPGRPAILMTRTIRRAARRVGLRQPSLLSSLPSRSARRPTARSSVRLPIAASSDSNRASACCLAPEFCGTRP